MFFDTEQSNIFYAYSADMGSIQGVLPLLLSWLITYLFFLLIISSRKKLYRIIPISRRIAWYPPIQTLVCSHIEVLIFQDPFPMSSGNAAGLQFNWQWVSVTLCLDVKWNTSTGLPVLIKWVSPIRLIWASNLQLLSKIKNSGVDWGVGKTAFANV